MQSYSLSDVGLHKEKQKVIKSFACDFNSTLYFTLMSMFLIRRDLSKAREQDICFIIIRSPVNMRLDGTHLGERLSL